MRPRILIAESTGFPEHAADRLRRVGDLTLADLNRPGLLSAIRESHVLWVRLRYHIDAEVLAAASLLRVIVTPTTGLNHIDVEDADRRGVQVLSLQGQAKFLEDVRATAEYTLALMLALLRHLPAAAAHAAHGGWHRDLFKGHELYGRSVGVVGYGRVGRIVARYLRAFEAQVFAADPHVDARAVEPGVRLVPLPELLREADTVTLHVSLSAETRRFFGREQFGRMKSGAWFINSARGELVDEAALLHALRSGRLAGAAVDVLCDERATGMTRNRLVAFARAHDNLIITPHIGGCTAESMEKTETFLAERLSALLSSLFPPAGASDGQPSPAGTGALPGGARGEQ